MAMAGSGAQETLMPATTIDPTASTVSISTTATSTADTASGSFFNSQPIMVASFVVGLTDIAVDLLILLLLIVVICLLLRLLHMYSRHKPSEKLNEEGVATIVQEPAEKAVAPQTCDAATQTDTLVLSPGPVSPLIGELGVALQRRTRTIKQKSDTTIGIDWLPDLTEESSEPGNQSTSTQERTPAATPLLESSSLSCRSPVKLSPTDKQSPEVKSKAQPDSHSTTQPVEETEEPDIQQKTMLKTSASAPMLNLKKLSSKNTSKPGAATGNSDTLKLPKKKRFTLKRVKDKRYKQKEMENEVAEPVSLEEENPELVMLVRMVRLEGNEEDDEKTTDL